MKTLTNILNYEINRDAINNDFYIVRFENEIDFKKVNSRLLDNPDINILSLSYSYGKNAYDKNASNKNAYDKDAKDKNSYNYGNENSQY